MADTRDLIVRIKGDTSDFKRSMGEVSTESAAATSKLSGLAGIAGIATRMVEAGAVAAAAFGITSVRAFSDSENQIAQTNAVLKSTAGVAGVSADMVDKLSKSWEHQTKYSDEAVRSAENMLLTFTNIHKDVFPQTTQAVLDMSTAMHQDLQSTSIQVGKALQDPVKGVTALQRVGVRLSDSQKALVEQMVATGDVAGAQGVILQELQREFGGSAKAAGDTFAGSLAKLKNNMDDMQESIGQTLVKALSPFLQKLADTVSTQQFQDGLQRVIFVLLDFLKIVGKVISILITMTDWLGRHRIILAAVAGVIGGVLVAAFVAWAVAAAEAALATIAATWPILAIGAAVGVLAYLVVGHWETIKNAFQAGVEWIKDHWLLLASILLNPFGFIISEIIKHRDTIVNTIAAIPGAIAGVFTSVVSAIKSAVGGFGTLLHNAGKDLMSGLINGIKDSLKEVENAIGNIGKSAVTKMKDVLGIHSPSTVFMDIGTNMGQGLINGIADQMSDVKTAVNDLAAPSIIAGQQAASTTANRMAAGVPASSSVAPVNFHPEITINLGIYAGMPIEKRQIAVDLWRELVRAARAQGVQLPMIGVEGVQ